ncbi:MAG TPA: class II aldolase/adducin family protein [Acidobacteriota bacterium]|nr:class II aldolase/adducin family protein [Acidobacteriota bacterium]
MNEEQIRRDICEVGRRMYARHLISGMDGNISVRLDDDRIMATPTGMSKGFLKPDDIVITDMEGKKLEGKREPSSELLLHLSCYRNRPDVKAVVHAHPPVCTGFAVAGIPLNKALLAEVIVTFGCIPIAPYGTPSTEELATSCDGLITKHDALLLANHGALTVGHELFATYFKMETIEHFANINMVAHILGKENILPAHEVSKLAALRERYGLVGPDPFTEGCPIPLESAGTSETVTLTRSELIQLISEAIKSVQ